MKVILTLLVMMTAAAVFSEMERQKPITKEESLEVLRRMTPQERDALTKKHKADIEMRVGGYLVLPSTGNVIRVINKQKAVPEEDVCQLAKEMCDIVGMTMEIKTEDCDDNKVAARIELNEDGNAPVLLIAPEDKFGRLNVDRLRTDNPAQTLLRLRFAKEFWRVTGMTLGAFNSNVSPCIMRNIYSLHDLDKDPAQSPSPEVFDKIQNTCRQLGIQRPRRISYRRACIEGIAPAPTNDIQKAIWDKVHTMPTEPIKIMPEEKKTEK